MKLKAFEEALLKEIWLGDPAEADRMISRLRSLPKGNLNLVTPKPPPPETTPGKATR